MQKWIYLSCLRANFGFCLQRANIQKKKFLFLVASYWLSLWPSSLLMSICTQLMTESDKKYIWKHESMINFHKLRFKNIIVVFTVCYTVCKIDLY